MTSERTQSQQCTIVTVPSGREYSSKKCLLCQTIETKESQPLDFLWDPMLREKKKRLKLGVEEDLASQEERSRSSDLSPDHLEEGLELCQ